MPKNRFAYALLFFSINIFLLFVGTDSHAQLQGGVSYLPVPDLSAATYTLAVHEVNFEGVSILEGKDFPTIR